MKLKSYFKTLSKLIYSPIVIATFLGIIDFEGTKALANTKTKPADIEDLSLYQGMGISFVCTASRKEVDIDFNKAVGVASDTFVTVVEQKHGGLIFEQGKEVKVDRKTLFTNVSFRILGGAINVCPDNVPENSKKMFEQGLKQIEKLNKSKNKNKKR